MKWSVFWQKSFLVRRALLCAFIAWHLFATFMNNLSWSPLVAKFFDTYSPYLTFTGTVQDGWAMYSQVHTYDNHYHLIGTLPDGSERQLDFAGQTRPGMVASRLRDFLEERDITFLESVASDAPDDVNLSFATYLCRGNPDIVSVRFDMLSAPIPPLEEWTAPLDVSAYETTEIFSFDCPSA